MTAATHQTPFRFTAEADPRYCARAFCRVRRQKKSTHAVTVDGKTYRLCSSCARPYESVRGAKVEKIGAEVAGV